MEVRLKYDELSSKRKFQKLLEKLPEPEVLKEEIVPLEKPDFKHLQRALIKECVFSESISCLFAEIEKYYDFTTFNRNKTRVSLFQICI